MLPETIGYVLVVLGSVAFLIGCLQFVTYAQARLRLRRYRLSGIGLTLFPCRPQAYRRQRRRGTRRSTCSR